jgi:DNA repair protein RecN (Recombination protein N)
VLLISRDWRLQEERGAAASHRRGGVSRAQLLELRPLLLDLTVQGQTQQLARPGQQRRWLDRFAGEDHCWPWSEAAWPFRAWKAAAGLWTPPGPEQQQQQERQRRLQLLEDLEAAHLDDPAERQRLQGEQDRLAHGVRLQEGVMTTDGAAGGGADAGPVGAGSPGRL